MQVLVREGYLSQIEGSGSSEFKVIRQIPDVAECNRAISFITAAAEAKYDPVDAIVPFGKRIEMKFTEVLQGKMDPLELLFPEDGAEFGAGRLYNECEMPKMDHYYFSYIYFKYILNSSQHHFINMSRNSGFAPFWTVSN
jgi:hypothetical protein